MYQKLIKTLYPKLFVQYAFLSKEKVRAVDMVWAFKSGLSFVEEDDGKNYRLAIALVLNEPDKPEVIEALKTLGVTPGKNHYILRPPTDAMLIGRL